MPNPRCFKEGFCLAGCPAAEDGQDRVAPMQEEKDDIAIEKLYPGTPAADRAGERRLDRVSRETAKSAIASGGRKCRK